MGVWVRRPDLNGGEAIVWKRAANRQQSQYRSVGGRLYLTTERLVFEPNIVDRVSGGQDWTVALGTIRGVTEEKASRLVPHQGQAATWRRRLRVRTLRGSELFVVNSIEDVIEELQRLIGVGP